jgi:glycerol-3-phosphate dehydrogenase
VPVRFCGLGAMGSAIAERLLAQGHRLTVWNRIAGCAAVLVTRDATRATTPPIKFTFAHPVAANWRRAQKLARSMCPLMAHLRHCASRERFRSSGKSGHPGFLCLEVCVAIDPDLRED